MPIDDPNSTIRVALQARAHIEKPPELRADAQEIAREPAIDFRQISGLGFDELADGLLQIGPFARMSLHQRRIGDIRFVMKTLESVGDETAAEGIHVSGSGQCA
ncbi:hypothetical protein [Bradyrhizobium sp.]|uniref:hypothetical protein n=1 Tax=Bradyrhizobium sp. TaxID=376 RepID=UPI0039E60F22